VDGSAKINLYPQI